MFEFIQHLFKVIVLIFISFFIIIGEESLAPTIDNPNEALIEEIEIIRLDVFPVQANVIAKGYLPNRCSTINHVTEERSDNTLTIKIIIAPQIEPKCAQVSQPFEEVIPLNIAGLSAGIYNVKVNQSSERFELGVDNFRP